MYLVRDAMSRYSIVVSPDATVRTAVELLQLHGLDALPVVLHEQVVGMLEPLTLCLYDGEVPVQELLDSPVLKVEAHLPLAQAAMFMRKHRLRQVPVVRDGVLVGLLAERDLLAVWGTTLDSLTRLPFQPQLRRRLSSLLQSKRETAVLFIDLDDFGKLNKRRGHVFGDCVLQRVADVIRECVDPDTDFACRYGGDEFAIGTTRSPAGAMSLARKIIEQIAEIPDGTDLGKVSASIGIAGGRRVKVRPGMHPDATLDDLLNRASKASTSAKQDPNRICYFMSEPLVMTATEGATAVASSPREDETPPSSRRAVYLEGLAAAPPAEPARSTSISRRLPVTEERRKASRVA